MEIYCKRIEDPIATKEEEEIIDLFDEDD